MISTSPRIYVSCRTRTKSGIWIDATQKPEDIKTEIQELIENTPTDSWDLETCRIQEYEGFGDLRLTSDLLENLSLLSRVANAIAYYGNVGLAALQLDPNPEWVVDAVKFYYYGSYKHLRDFGASVFWEERNQVSQEMSPYFDFDRLAQDLLKHHYFCEMIDGRYYVFKGTKPTERTDIYDDVYDD